MAITSNPYADRDKVQQQISQQVPVVQQPYNLFAQEKASGYSQQVAATEPPRTVAASPVANVGGANVGGASSGGAVVQNAGSSYSQPIRSTEELARAMGYTSPEEEERLRRASVANQRIMAVADALRHIGNIYNTTHGAPAQKFNNPVLEEQTRYKQGKALRDAANAKYLNYQQAKAAQDAKQKQWEETFKYNALRDAAKLKAQQDYQAATLKERARVADQNLEFNKSKQKATEERWKRMDDESVRSHKANEALKRQSNGIAAGSLNLRKQQFEYKKQHGGGSGGGRGSGTLTFRGKNGFYSKPMNSQEVSAFYNQTYDEMKRRGLINEGKVLEGLPADIFGQKSVSASAKKAAVDNALMQHPEVGDWLVNKYEFEFSPRGSQEATTPRQTANINFAPWNSQPYAGDFGSTFTPNAYDEDEEEDLFDEDDDFSGISI